MSDIIQALEKALGVTKTVVIIAEEVEGEALATLVVNKMRGTLSPLAIKAPGFGDRRKSMIEDMAILTGANVISEELGRKLDSVTVEELGRARRVVSTQEETTSVGGWGSAEARGARRRGRRRRVGDGGAEQQPPEAPAVEEEEGAQGHQRSQELGSGGAGSHLAVRGAVHQHQPRDPLWSSQREPHRHRASHGVAEYRRPRDADLVHHLAN